MKNEIHDWSVSGKRYLKLLFMCFAEKFGKLRVLNLTVGAGYTLKLYPESVELVVGVDINPQVKEIPEHLRGKIEIVKSDYFKYLNALSSTEKFNVVEIDAFSSLDGVSLLKSFLRKRNSSCGYHVTFYDSFIKRKLYFKGEKLDLGEGLGRLNLPKELLSSIPYIVVRIVENVGWTHELFIYQYEKNTWHVGGIIEKNKDYPKICLLYTSPSPRDRG